MWQLSLRQTLRQLRRDRGFLWAALLSVGMASAVAALALAYVLMLSWRPLPYRDASQLWDLRFTLPSMTEATHGLQASLSTALQFGLAHPNVAMMQTAELPLAPHPRGDAPWRMINMVSAHYARILGLHLQTGSWPAPNQGAAVLSAALARAWFGGAQGALGQTVYLKGRPLRIAGVLRSDYLAPLPLLAQRGRQATALLVPTDFTPQLLQYQKHDQMRQLSLVGRGARQILYAAVQNFLDRTANSRTSSLSLDATVSALPQQMLQQARQLAAPLLGLAAVLFGSALLGFAVFALARYAARIPEWTVHGLLGGRGWRSAIPDAVELVCVLLLAAASALILLALISLIAGFNPVLNEILDRSLLLRTAALLPLLLLLVAVLLWGLRSWQWRQAQRTLAAEGRNRRSGALTRGDVWILRAVLALQVLVAVVAGMLVMATMRQSMQTLRIASAQDWQTVTALKFKLVPKASAGAITQSLQRLRGALARWPGMEVAALSNSSPIDLQGQGMGFILGLSTVYSLRFVAVDPEYFHLFHYRLLWHRLFRAGEHNVAVFTPAALRAVTGSTHPQALVDAVAPPYSQAKKWNWNDHTRVVGMVQASPLLMPGHSNPFASDAVVFIPFSAASTDMINHREAWVLARGTHPPDASQLKAMVGAAGIPALAWQRVDLAQQVRLRVLTQLGVSLSMLLLGLVVFVAVAQAAYAAMRYALLRRSYDYAIRMAIGADPSTLRRQYTRRELLAPLLAALATGAALLWVLHVLPSWRQQWGVSIGAGDVLLAVVLIALLVLLALVRALRRFARQSPLAALRTE